MRWFAVLLVLAACGGSSFRGDVTCEADADCAAGRCVPVDHVLASTGACLASSGAKVCRAICTDCAKASPCGCQCP